MELLDYSMQYQEDSSSQNTTNNITRKRTHSLPRNMMQLELRGQGRPHSAASIAAKQQLPPAIATMRELQKQFLFIVSLEFMLGDLDNLQQSDTMESGRT